MTTETYEKNILTQYLNATKWLPQPLVLNLPGLVVSVSTNHEEIHRALQIYFRPVLAKQQLIADCDIVLVDDDAHPDMQSQPWASWKWTEWTREAGKTGRKDAVMDLDNSSERLIYKYKTGVVFWQKMQSPAAFGPLRANLNQVINFILNQSLNAHQRQGWTLGHAAGLSLQQTGLAIAGLSGGGKSTLMLHLLNEGARFISNDRVLMKKHDRNTVCLRGIPKQPRVNPGTLLHNSHLNSLLPQTRQESLLDLPPEELWAIEEKYDVDVEVLYGSGTYQAESPLHLLVILDWSFGKPMATKFEITTLETSPSLLPAIMKSAGPFYHSAHSGFMANGTAPIPDDYLDVLQNVPCVVLSGGVDFEAAVGWLLTHAPSFNPAFTPIHDKLTFNA